MSDTKNKTDLSKYTVNVQGKDYITFPGLLAEAHAQGLTDISTELLTPLDLTNPIVKATVKFGDKTFSGYGDANSNNVAKKVAGALIRMAETRAVARALRFACNIDMTALEELDVESSDTKASKPASTKAFVAPSVVQKTETTEAAVVEQPKLTTPTKTTSAKSFGPAPTVAAAPVAGPTLAKRKAASTEPSFP